MLHILGLFKSNRATICSTWLLTWIFLHPRIAYLELLHRKSTCSSLGIVCHEHSCMWPGGIFLAAFYRSDALVVHLPTLCPSILLPPPFCSFCQKFWQCNLPSWLPPSWCCLTITFYSQPNLKTSSSWDPFTWICPHKLKCNCPQHNSPSPQSALTLILPHHHALTFIVLPSMLPSPW